MKTTTLLPLCWGIVALGVGAGGCGDDNGAVADTRVTDAEGNDRQTDDAALLDAAPDGETKVTVPASFDVQGHRGARGLKPEETLPAFETALDLGVNTLELDLHYTQDGVVVVWHDAFITLAKCRIDPSATAPLPPDPDQLPEYDPSLMVSSLTFEQLKKYRCDRNPDPAEFPEQTNTATALAGDRYHVVSLEELFTFVERYAADASKTQTQRDTAATVHFNMETKRKELRPEYINDGFDGENPGPFETAILQIVESRGLVARTIIQSFDLRSLWAVRKVNGDIRLAVLTQILLTPLAEYAAKGANIWSPRYIDVRPETVAEARAAGLKIIPWTVNTAEHVRDMIEQGVDGLITDRPDLVLELIERR